MFEVIEHKNLLGKIMFAEIFPMHLWPSNLTIKIGNGTYVYSLLPLTIIESLKDFTWNHQEQTTKCWLKSSCKFLYMTFDIWNLLEPEDQNVCEYM